MDININSLVGVDFLLKICSKCGIEKKQSEFYKHKRNKDGLESICISCKKEYMILNKDVIKITKSKYYLKNKEILKSKKSKIKTKEYNSKYSKNNKEKIKEINKKYFENLSNDKKLSRRNNTKKWISKNVDRVRKNKNEYKKRKFNSDIIFQLKHNINTMILLHLRNNNLLKKSRTHEILGCSINEFKLYLESKFEPWMTWDNRGLYNGEFNHGWDIDHIIPISSSKTEEEIIKLNHYTNLQPLCSKVNRDIKRDNLRKGNKYE